MPVDVPTVYTEPGPSGADDDQLVCVRLPADVVDELALGTVWLSVQLKHQVSVPVLRRALLLAGLAHPSRALAALRRGQAGRSGTDADAE